MATDPLAVARALVAGDLDDARHRAVRCARHHAACACGEYRYRAALAALVARAERQGREVAALRLFAEQVGRYVASGVCNECRESDCDRALVSTCLGWRARRLLRDHAALAGGGWPVVAGGQLQKAGEIANSPGDGAGNDNADAGRGAGEGAG